MNAIVCRLTQRRLATVAGGRPGGAADRHLDHCLRCQAEAVRYRKLVRSLAELADTEATAPDGFVEAVDRALGPRPVSAPASTRRGPAAVVAMLGAAAATAGTVVVVRMVRARTAA